MNHSVYMRRAIELAQRGIGRVAPNPLVGALIVANNEIIGEGWHAKYGDLHAERHALEHCQRNPAGADMYVTLEPCCHQGKQPPCTEAIVEAGIKRVFIGSDDPNPLVAGKGIAYLRQHGIEVFTGIEKEACDELNRVFFHYIKSKRPYVVMKYAMTMDGKIATRCGLSQWITGEEARRRVHEDRNRYTAIMVGSGTVLSDNPLLTCRIPGGRNPIRIVCDTKLRTPLDSHLVQTAKEVQTIIATAVSDENRCSTYRNAGCQMLTIPCKEGHLSMESLMRELGKAGIDSILMEGGGTLNWASLEAGIVQKVQAYIAPKLFGGETAKSPIGGAGVELPTEAITLVNSKVVPIGSDFLIESEVRKHVHGDC